MMLSTFGAEIVSPSKMCIRDSNIPRPKLIIKRNYFTVYLRAYAFIAYSAVDAVSKIERSRARDKILYISLWRKYKNIVRKQVDLKRLHKFLGVFEVVLPLHQLTPVSYTHLDVYKRQVHRLLVGKTL